MKYIIKRVLIILVIVMSLSFFSNVKAQGERLIEMAETVSIRKKTETSGQGFKFSANLHKDAIEDAHGFYIAYGEVAKEDLVGKINDAKGKEFTINGKKVFHVKVSGLKEDNSFAVVLTGIPKTNYIDKVSVLGYVEVRGVTRYSDKIITRSIAEVAFGGINNNNGDKDLLLSIIADMDQQIVFGRNVLNEMELNNNFYEYNHKYLKEEFNKDFKKLVNVEFLDLETDENDLESFFQDSYYKVKWGFLLDYFLSLSNNEILNCQIDDLKAANECESLEEFIYALTNFFNEENYKGDLEVIDFTNLENYLTLKVFNNQVLINPNNYRLFKEGEELVIPEVAAEDDDLIGYIFSHYLADGTEYRPSDIYTIENKNVVFTKEYIYKEHKISFLHESGELLEEVNVKHNDNIKALPNYESAGLVAVSWIDQDEKTVNMQTKITKDLFLTPVFKTAINEITITIVKSTYTVFEASANIEYEIVYSSFNYNYLYITPKDGYGFAKNIIINVNYTDGDKSKFIGQKIEPEHIEYIYDDPNWSGIY